MLSVKEKFKSNPLLYYALSICATWAGIGSLMNGVAMTQKLGIIPSLIWVLGNTVACILFGYLALWLPKVREVFCSKVMLWICGIMCVFQSWLSMNGMQAVFADTSLGSDAGMYIAYAEAVFFIVILYRFGMIRNVLTDGFGWLIVYLLAVGVTITALYQSAGHFNSISLGLHMEPMKEGIWKAVLLLPGPFTYPYFFRILDYNDGNKDGTAKVDARKAFTLGGIFFGIYMLVMAIKNMKVEFEYTLTDGEIDIAKINDKSRRKDIKNIRKDDVTLIKKADSDKVKNDLSLKKEKIVYFVKEVTDTCYAIYTSINDKKEILVLDLDEGCVEHLKAMYKRTFEE